ncbi:hypothetical protein [Adhaeribacter rhizoryzae]|uniref:SGNH/GDSL hydrolase family protein n=1 Tax=Adhaeribacter rhizoryzae TaxID=2607907 RepID=A0A5M6D930_9BACT|nr:hypothetical protein [Adhaeribacter rhizoryzae]KAA5544011.1 hypothetical protein F0145_15640 [Adhaeribacter rhizoryzae]
MKAKILTSLLLASFFLSMACNSRKIDNDTYMSEPGGAVQEASATDQAETIAAINDTTRVIILGDSVKPDSSGL